MGTLVWPARLMPRILRCGISAQWERTHTEVQSAIFPRRAKCTSWLPTLVHLVTSSSCLCPTTTWQRCVCQATQCQVLRAPEWTTGIGDPVEDLAEASARLRGHELAERHAPPRPRQLRFSANRQPLSMGLFKGRELLGQHSANRVVSSSQLFLALACA